MLLTTHYMEEAERLCDRVAVVDHGRIIREGSPRALIATLGAAHVVEFELDGRRGRPTRRRCVGCRGSRRCGATAAPGRSPSPSRTACCRALIAHARGGGQGLARLGTRQATLEDVFVALTGRHLRDG